VDAPNGFEVRLLALFLGTALILSPAPATEAFPKELANELEAVLARYAAAIPVQHDAMLGMQIEANYEGRFIELHEQGRWRINRIVSKLGDVTFRPIAGSVFVGDERVKKELIARTMEEEQKEKAYGAFKVTKDDYKFSINAKFTKNARSSYVFDVTPRRKAPGLFEGQVEIDGDTGMPLRETGRLVKNPHWILSNVRFTREYEMYNGIAVVKTFVTQATVRLGIGTAEIIAHYSDFRPAEEQPARERALLN